MTDAGFEADVATMLRRRATDIADRADGAVERAVLVDAGSMSTQRSRTPLFVAAAVLLVVAGAAFLLNGGNDKGRAVETVAHQADGVEQDVVDWEVPNPTPGESLEAIGGQPIPALPALTICDVEVNNQSPDPDIPAELCLPVESFVVHQIEPGDLLSAIAEQFNVSVADILAVNPSLDSNILLVGHQLWIPTTPLGLLLANPPPPRAPVCPASFDEVDSDGDNVVDLCMPAPD